MTESRSGFLNLLSYLVSSRYRKTALPTTVLTPPSFFPFVTLIVVRYVIARALVFAKKRDVGNLYSITSPLSHRLYNAFNRLNNAREDRIEERKKRQSV